LKINVQLALVLLRRCRRAPRASAADNLREILSEKFAGARSPRGREAAGDFGLLFDGDLDLLYQDVDLFIHAVRRDV